MQNKAKFLKKYWGLFFMLLVIDQTIKFLFIIFWPNIIYKNLFGIASFNIWFQIALFLFLTILLIYIIKFNKSENKFWLYQLIFAGAYSNLLDRIFRGYVVDYIPVFNAYLNISDLFILIGLLFILLDFRKVKSG